MSLLVLQSVSKCFSTGRRERLALHDVSLDLGAGEFVAVWGLRRSGRTTLLRVAAGLEAPDEGVVCFDGDDLARSRDEVLGSEIGYVTPTFAASHGATVVDHVALGLLATGLPLERARARAHDALGRVDAAGCADLDPRVLDAGELARVGLARALAARPRLLLLDDPTNGVDVLQRDPFLALVRSIADEGVAVLMAVSDAVTIADRVLSIDDGRLHGELAPEPAQVVQLRAADPRG